MKYFTKGGTTWKWVWVFSNSERNVRNSVKSRWKKWGHLSNFHLSKKVHFLQFCADLSKKSKYVKAIYIYASQRSRCAVSFGLYMIIQSNPWNINLKELWNCILCIICMWSLFCSVRVYISLQFLPILLEN